MPLDSIAALSLLDRVTDANGDVVPGAVMTFYAAGTTTPLTVYSDPDLSVALGSVVTCDAGGYPTSDGNTQVTIYTGTASYKIDVKNASGITVLTRDNIRGASAIPTDDTAALPETPVVSRTSTYVILTTDQGKLINADPTSGSFGLTLPSAITAGDGWRIGIRHAGNSSNVVTVRTTSGQTIACSGQSAATAHALTGRGHTRWYSSDGASGYTVDVEVPPLMSGPIPFFRVTDRLTAPPVSPVGGSRYIINGTPSGAWLTLGFAEEDVAESDGNGSWFKYTPQAGWFGYVVDEDLFTKYDGSNWEDQTGMGAPSTSTLQRAIFEHREVDGTAGGSSTANLWQNRTLNTSVANNVTGLSLATSVMTLAAGTYLISAMQHLYAEVGTLGGVTFAQQRLAAGTAVLGETHLGVGSRVGGVATGAGVTFTSTNSIELRDTFVVTVTVGGTVSLQYYVTTAQATNGLGYPSPETTVGFECFARVSIVSLSALQGPPGTQGVQGEGGLDASYPYQWSTSTSGDPGSGKVRGNNATIASITSIGISEADSAGGAMAGVLATWDDSTSAVRGTLRIAAEGATQNFHVFHISGAGTDAGSYWTFPVTYVATSGTIANGTDCAIAFAFSGDKGDAGITTPTLSGLSVISDWDPLIDELLVYDVSGDAMMRMSVSGDTKFGSGIRLRDGSTAVTSGGLVRVTTSGGTTYFQINTAADGEFGTVVNALSISSGGDVTFYNQITQALDHTVSSAATTAATAADTAVWLGVATTMSGSSTKFDVPYMMINTADTVSNNYPGGYNHGVGGLKVQHDVQSGAGIGNRFGHYAILSHSADTGTSGRGTHDFYTASFGQCLVNANDGGTGVTLATSKGNYYGFGGGVFVSTPGGSYPAGPWYFSSIIGAEFDVELPAGANAREKIGLQVALVNDDDVQGTDVDAAIAILSDGFTARAGWKTGIIIGKPDTQWPIDPTTGSILAISTSLTGADAYEAGYGINLSGITFTQRAFQSTGFEVYPDGSTYAKVLRATSNTGLQVLDTDLSHALTIAPGSNLTAARTLTINTGDVNQALDLGWTTFTPTITSTTGPMASVTVAKAKYIRSGKLVVVFLDFTLTDATGGSSAIEVTPPVAAESGQSGACAGREVAVTGWLVGGQVSNTSIFITKYDGTTAIATGRRFNVTATYIAA